MAINVKADFSEDMRQEMLSGLLALGYAVDASAKIGDLALTYFNVKLRLIEPRPRRVERSRELWARALSPDRAKVVESISARCERGEDLRAFMSRRIAKPDYYDRLLNDWGIHHLHLGSDVPGQDGFVDHVADLLYVMVRPDEIYFIDVLGHAKDFANSVLLEIVHSNWPQLIARFRAPPQVISITPQFTSEQRLRFREAGLITAIQLRDGAIYISPGGGFSTAGNSTVALMRGDYHRIIARNAESWCRKNAAVLQDEVRKARGRDLEQLRLRYAGIENGMALIMEEETNVLFRIQIETQPQAVTQT